MILINGILSTFGMHLKPKFKTVRREKKDSDEKVKFGKDNIGYNFIFNKYIIDILHCKLNKKQLTVHEDFHRIPCAKKYSKLSSEDINYNDYGI